jgi:hypothetical protein
MRYVQIFCLTLGLALCSTISAEAQNEEFALRVIDSINASEPGWQYVPVLESAHIRLVLSEKMIVVGIWRHESDREEVHVWIYQVENRREAAKWLKPVRTKQTAPGWHISGYRIGDEGYVSKYRNGERFDIQFRTGNIVCKIAGDSLTSVSAFAEHLVDQVSAK